MAAAVGIVALTLAAVAFEPMRSPVKVLLFAGLVIAAVAALVAARLRAAAKQGAPNLYDWRRRFVVLARVEGRWVFCGFIEERRDYNQSYMRRRRLIRAAPPDRRSGGAP